jgi:hypothetical protein
MLRRPLRSRTRLTALSHRRSARHLLTAMRALLAVSAGVLLVSGCGAADQRTESAEGETSPSGAAVAPTGWRPTTEDKQLLERTEDLLAGQCMRALGFRYWAAPAVEASAIWDLPYAIDDPAWAKQHGYGGADGRRRDKLAAQDPNRRYLSGLSPTRQTEYNRALFGPMGTASVSATTPAGDELVVGSTGCLAHARTELYGDLRTWFVADTVGSNLQPLVAAKVTADPRYRRGLASWAACARRHGHGVSSPEQLQATVPAGDEQLEREYALVEATCAAQTGFGAVTRALDRQDQAVVEQQYAAPMRTLRGLQYRALRAAHKLTGQPAGNN